MNPLISSHSQTVRPKTPAVTVLSLFYALEDVRTQSLLTTAGPDAFPLIRLFPTFVDACDARDVWYVRQFADEMVPPPAKDVVRIVPLRPAHVRAIRDAERAARQYQAICLPPPSRTSHAAGCRRILRALDALPARPWHTRAFDWIAANLLPLALIAGALWLLAQMGTP